MAIHRDNLRFYLSGGKSNANPSASIGGPRSDTQVDGKLNGLFDDVTGDEAAIGETEYRCVYFINEDIDRDGLIDPVLWVAQQTPGSRTRIEFGIDPAGKNEQAPLLESMFIAPVGVVFSAPSIKQSGTALPGQPYHRNDFAALWISRVVMPGAEAGEEHAILRLAGDTF